MANKYDALDVQQLVESAVNAFCEQFGITGREGRQKVLQQIAATARAMKGEQ